MLPSGCLQIFIRGSSATEEELRTDTGLILLLLVDSKNTSVVEAALPAAVLSPPLKISLIPSRMAA
jgi:hypothetical protein